MTNSASSNRNDQREKLVLPWSEVSIEFNNNNNIFCVKYENVKILQTSSYFCGVEILNLNPKNKIKLVKNTFFFIESITNKIKHLK